MYRIALKLLLPLLLVLTACTRDDAPTTNAKPAEVPVEHPYLFHLVQTSLWEQAQQNGATYYPPTYEQDGFTHATANPDLLLNVANHFYPDVPGQWQCLRMTADSLEAAGVDVVFEATAPVGDKQPNFEGTDDELFPHILGGIPAAAVLEVHAVTRSPDGTFLSVSGVTDQ